MLDPSIPNTTHTAVVEFMFDTPYVSYRYEGSVYHDQIDFSVGIRMYSTAPPNSDRFHLLRRPGGTPGNTTRALSRRRSLTSDTWSHIINEAGAYSDFALWVLVDWYPEEALEPMTWAQIKRAY